MVPYVQVQRTSYKHGDKRRAAAPTASSVFEFQISNLLNNTAAE
jgi:hypothetical protein